MRSFRDRDFLSTKEGFLFCVVGPYHPDDRVISYLKYLPDLSGKWHKGKKRFRRVMQAYTIPSLLETFNLLKTVHPQYLFFSSVYNITMTAVPNEYIAEHFKPEEKLVKLFRKSRLDHLQKKVLRLVSKLSEFSAVPIHSFGVTGSILLDIHNPIFSDMDLTLYGLRNSYAVKKALAESLIARDIGVERFEGKRLREWYLTKTRGHPISFDDAEGIYRRKWNIGMFDGTPFSVHPVKLEEELTERYGDKTYRPCGMVNLHAVVVDSQDSIFLPAVYKVREARVNGKTGTDVEEVVSYEGLYDSLAEEGETIEVRGKMEHVVDCRGGKEYDRVLVGSPEGEGKEYIRPLLR